MMRRQIVLGIFAVMVSLLGQGLAAAATTTAIPEQPNLYKLTNRNMHVVYSTTSLTGEPRLSYRDRNLSLSFAGDEIRVLATEIGQQVTLTLEQVPDLKTVTFTLLIPDINLKNGPTLFKTSAITTTHRTTIGGPGLVEGQIQSYVTRGLLGVASHVVYLQSGQATVIGEVTLSPTCPGPQRPGQQCVQPFADATVQLLDSFNNIAAKTMTDAAGMFTINVFPGDYTVHIDTGGRLPACPDTAVTAVDKESVSVTINCDTGIR
jgi:hypothetical protein